MSATWVNKTPESASKEPALPAVPTSWRTGPNQCCLVEAFSITPPLLQAKWHSLFSCYVAQNYYLFEEKILVGSKTSTQQGLQPLLLLLWEGLGELSRGDLQQCICKNKPIVTYIGKMKQSWPLHLSPTWGCCSTLIPHWTSCMCVTDYWHWRYQTFFLTEVE